MGYLVGKWVSCLSSKLFNWINDAFQHWQGYITIVSPLTSVPGFTSTSLFIPQAPDFVLLWAIYKEQIHKINYTANIDHHHHRERLPLLVGLEALSSYDESESLTT